MKMSSWLRRVVADRRGQRHREQQQRAVAPGRPLDVRQRERGRSPPVAPEDVRRRPDRPRARHARPARPGGWTSPPGDSSMLIESSTGHRRHRRPRGRHARPHHLGVPRRHRAAPARPAARRSTSPRCRDSSEAGRGQVSGSAWYLTGVHQPCRPGRGVDVPHLVERAGPAGGVEPRGLVPARTTPRRSAIPDLQSVWQHTRRGPVARHRLHRDDRLRHADAGPADRSLLGRAGGHRRSP